MAKKDITNFPSAAEKRPQSSETIGESSRMKIPKFPMDEHRAEVVECVRHNQNAVIIGETGSGKTTRIPDFLLDEFPEAKIAITQPRRVAARSVSRYIAGRRGERVGDEIGYQVRFEDKTTEGTRANFMTDGILLRKLQFDPLLEEYDIVMVDEAHERNLNIDFVLGLLKRVQAERKKRGMKELKVIAASATIEKEKFANYFGGSPTVEVPGRMHPVDVRYENEQVKDYTKAAAEKVKEITSSGGPGDILIFMPGEQEIRRTIQEIGELNLSNVEVMPLFGAMAPEDQDKIFEKNQNRKVIVSTNIAETSVTIDGVRFVIDSGLIKQKEFDPNTGIEALLTKRHAKSGCEQRKGRAGRTAPGTCYRLYPEADYSGRDGYQTPEIARSNLDHVILAMKKIGIEDVRNFEFIDPPKEEAIAQAIETLKMLGALDANEKLTKIGKTMAELPLRPEIARMVIEAEKYHCAGKICTVAAMMGDKSVFVRPKGKEHEADAAHAQFAKGGSDFLKMLEVWQQWSAAGFNDKWARDHYLNVRQLFEVREIRSQLMRELKKQEIIVDDTNGNDSTAIQKCVASGLIQHLMNSTGRHAYEHVIRGSGSDAIFIHPSSAAFSAAPQMMIGANVVTTSKTFARLCQPVIAKWLPEIAPQLLEENNKSLRYDADSDSVMEKVGYSLRGRYGIIAEEDRKTTDDAAAAEQFVRALAEGKVDLPSVKQNADTVRALQSLYVRSGGQARVPELLTWYKERAGGVQSKQQARYIDERLRINFDDYCSPEMKAEIDKTYPETIEVQGGSFLVKYEYRPADAKAYYESERNEKFRAIITIPGDMIFKLDIADFPTIGTGGRPEISYRYGEEYNSMANSDLEELKMAADNKRIESAWYSFKQPEIKPIEMQVLQPLPPLDSAGARPIAYVKNYKGEDVFAHPSYLTEEVYDRLSGEYKHKFAITYYRTEEEAAQKYKRALEAKSRDDEKARKKAERETFLVPAKEKYANMRSVMDQLFNTHSSYGVGSNGYYSLYEKWKNAGYALEDSDSDPKKAIRLMDEIQTVLANGQAERERRIALIPDIQTRIRALSEKMEKITQDAYARFGLSYDQYDRIRKKYREADNALQTTDINNKPIFPDPERAAAILDELFSMIPSEQEIIPEQQIKKRSIPRPYYEETPAETSTEKIGKGGFASLLSKAAGKQEAKPKIQVQVLRREAAKPAEKEKMTEELRSALADDLTNSRFFLEAVRAVPEPNKKSANADKISKVRVRATELKRDLAGIEKELSATDDAARARGKVFEIVKKAERAAEEISRFQNGREDWPGRYRSFMAKVEELAKAQDAALDKPALEKIKIKIAELARRKEEPPDLDGEIEAIIIDSI